MSKSRFRSAIIRNKPMYETGLTITTYYSLGMIYIYGNICLLSFQKVSEPLLGVYIKATTRQSHFWFLDVEYDNFSFLCAEIISQTDASLYDLPS